MSYRFNIDIIDIDIFFYRTYFKRYKVFLLIDLAYLASRYTFIYVYSRSYPFRGLLDKVEGAIPRVIAFVIKSISLGFLDR